IATIACCQVSVDAGGGPVPFCSAGTPSSLFQAGCELPASSGGLGGLYHEGLDCDGATGNCTAARTGFGLFCCLPRKGVCGETAKSSLGGGTCVEAGGPNTPGQPVAGEYCDANSGNCREPAACSPVDSVCGSCLGGWCAGPTSAGYPHPTNVC